jgi:ATP-binding cassette subfamily B protein
MIVMWGRGVVAVARLAFDVRPRIAIFGAVRAVVTGLLPVVLSVATARAVEASAGVVLRGFGSTWGDRLVDAMWLYVVIFAIQVGVSAVAGAQTQIGARHVDGALRKRVMAAALRPVGVRVLEDPVMQRAFDSARNMGMGVGYTAGSAAATLPAIIGDRIRLVGYLTGLTYLYWPVGLAFTLMTFVNQNEMLKAMARVLSITALFGAPPSAKYHFDLGARPGAAKEVRVFGLEDWVRQRYRLSILGFYRGAWEMRREFTPALVVVLGVNAMLTATALIALGLAGMRGDLGLAGLAFAIGAVMALSPRFNLDDVLLTIASGVIESIARAERLAASEPGPADGERADLLPAETIRFENVSFRYPGTDVDVLCGLNLELRSGERTALVGPNGVGKTTIVKLLCRLYEPTEGRITVDGRALSSLAPDAWRRQLAVLFQDYIQYELPASDNIRYGFVDAPTSGDPIGRAIARAGADFLLALPDGADTPLSPRYEGGVGLSGGQWQRVALARALFAVAEGAQVLVLDEPTASLDVRGEARIYDDFVSLTSGAGPTGDRPVTTLLISHRFSTVRQADRVVVLEGGCIVEDGSHDELMAFDARYAEMFNAQASRFA